MAEREVQLIYNNANIQIDLPINNSLTDIENWIKDEQHFTQALKGQGVTEIFLKTDILQFRYNSPNTEPALKALTLDQYHPKKKLIFFINKISQPKDKFKVQPIKPEKPKSIIEQASLLNISKQIPLPELTQLIFVVCATNEQGNNETVTINIKPNTTILDIQNILLKGKSASRVDYKDKDNKIINHTKQTKVKDIIKQNGLKLTNREDFDSVEIQLMNIYLSFKPIPKKVLFSLNKYLHPSYVPQSKFYAFVKHQMHYSYILNPSLIVKYALQFINLKISTLNRAEKKKRYWWVSILGLLLGYSTHYLDDIEKYLEYTQQDFIRIYNTKLQQLQSHIHEVAVSLVDQKVLKNQMVSHELQKLLYSICVSLSIVHITTQNINKVLQMGVVEENSIVLTKQVLIQKIFKQVAEEKLKVVVIYILRRPDIQQALQNIIMDYFNSEQFQGFITEQLERLISGQIFRGLAASQAKQIVMTNLKNDELQQTVYRLIKSRLQ